jgi:L-glyceraldehyde 3-phosphate reductase
MDHHGADPGRYEQMEYRTCGRSGIRLPALSLGVWQNFGESRPPAEVEALVTRAFDLGITHIDLANNYGPPGGAAEVSVGRVLSGALASYRDELLLSTKAGWEMWPGPYGDGGSRKYLLASLDASLRRLGVEYVDIFYSHRFDPATPLEETMGALANAVRQGKALYVGISNYPPDQAVEAAHLLEESGTPLLISQPPYSMLNRWLERGLLDTFGRLGVGCIVYSPLAEGLLTDRYLEGIPDDSRASRPDGTLDPGHITDELRTRLRRLAGVAERRGQTLAQMALAWVLRDPRVTSALAGASSVAQLEQNVAALANVRFGDDELAAIDEALGSP